MSVAFEAAWMLLKQRGHAPDRKTLANMGPHEQDDEIQEEADEMEAMGVPEMSRTLGGTPPPNIGRAGSTLSLPPHAEDMAPLLEDAMLDMGYTPEEIQHEFEMQGKPFNPFPKPLAGRVQDQIAEFADTAGRRAAMSPQPDYSKHENSTDLFFDSFDENFDPINSVPTDAHPEAHNIASTNLRQTPRKQKRGKMDSGQAFKRPGFRGPPMPLPGGKGD